MKNIFFTLFLLITFVNATRQERRIESEEVEIIIVEDTQPQKILTHRGLVPQLWPNYTRYLHKGHPQRISDFLTYLPSKI